MSKSIWYVFALGMVCVFCLMMGMCLYLETFSGSPAGIRAKLAENIRSRFGFESASVQVKVEDARKVLRISYETLQDSKYDTARQQQEMKEVADHAARHYEESDRREIEEIRVTRTETRGRGCWQDRQVARENFPNPAWKAPEPFRFPVQEK